MRSLTIIIPFFNGHGTIGKLLEDIPRTIPVIIVDDCSDTSYTAPYQLRNVRTMRLEQKGYFSGAVNAGIKSCSGDVLVLNQDTRLLGTGWLDLLQRESTRYAMIGEKIAGTHPAWPNGYIQGTFMYIRRDLLDAIGLLNETEYPLWGTTCEFQLRAARAGFEVLPLSKVPDFAHHRHDQRFGSSITQLLRRMPNKRDWFIRTPPLISVIVPCRNYGRFLPDMIASLIGGSSSLGQRAPQTLQSFEIVIVNDASEDDTAEIVNSLENPWKGIRVIHLPRQKGTAGANNAGIAAAFGKYITILSADDMREPDSLEYLYRALLKNPHSLAYDGVMPFGDGRLKPDVKIGVSDYDFEKMIFKNNVHAGIMFPKSAWEEVGGYPEVFSDGREDWAMNVRLGVAGYCGIFIDKKGYLYRREGQNRSLRNTNPKNREMFLAKLMGLYPAIYQGKRPEMCCGQKKKGLAGGGAVVTANTKRMVIPMDGDSVVLEYIGSSFGTQTFYGPATGAQYRAGQSKALVIVDAKDAITNSTRQPGLLEMRENGKSIFRRYVPPKPSTRLPAEPPIVGEETMVIEDETEKALPAELEQQPAKKPSDKPTIAEIYALCEEAGISPDDLELKGENPTLAAVKKAIKAAKAAKEK